MTTEQLANLLLETAPDYEGWSIVESPNSADYYEELLQWARSMNSAAWRVDSRRRPCKLGLVLLWLESEVARRHASDGALWPSLSDQNNIPWHESVRTQLFTAQNAATREHKDLLETCAREYQMRNTFDDDYGQNWYRLILLQFGFTHHDAQERLAPWLSGQVLPVSVQRLLESDDPGANAFKHMWRSLRMFRLGELPQARLEVILRSNPWILPEWCEDLVKAARRSCAQTLELADLDAAELRFFAAPRLCLDSEGLPYFTTSLCNLTELRSDSAAYQLKSGNKLLATLIRQEDGTYFTNPSGDIVLPRQPIVALSLIADDGSILCHDELILWDTMEEVSIYSPKTGLRIPPNQRVRSGAELFLIASSDLTIQPTPSQSVDLGLGYQLHLIAGGWCGSLSASLDQDVIWTSNVKTNLPGNGPVGASGRFTQNLDLRDHRWMNANRPWELPFRINIPQGWNFSRLRWRRADGRLVELNQIPQHLTLMEKDAVKPVVVRLRMHNGNRYLTEVLRIHVPFVAALKWDRQGTPHHHHPNGLLLLADASKYAWSFSLPTSADGNPRNPRQCQFLEGTVLHKRLSSRPATLPDLGGYGAPLRIVDAPYTSGASVMRVSRCVLDNGVLSSINWDGESFNIRSNLTVGPEHRLYVWFSEDQQSQIAEIDFNTLIQQQGGWRWMPRVRCHLYGAAIFYRGLRLGAWFDQPTHSQATVQSPPACVARTAALLRAWKAPLLDENHKMQYANWLRQNWDQILPVWLSKADLRGPNDCIWSALPLSPNWLGTVSELLLEALPDPNQHSASNIIASLAPNCEGIDALGSSVLKIAEKVCPILASRLARICLASFSATLRQQFLNQMLAMPDLSTSQERAVEIAKNHGNCDGFWLEITVPTLSNITQHGAAQILYAYRILSKIRDYRMYALGRLLSEIRNLN